MVKKYFVKEITYNNGDIFAAKKEIGYLFFLIVRSQNYIGPGL